MRRSLLIIALIVMGCEPIIGADFGPKELTSGSGFGGAGSGASSPVGSGASSPVGSGASSGHGPGGGGGSMCSPSCAWACDGKTCDDAVQISAGGDHACARRTSGKVACWGDNEHGQLGDGTTTSSAVPVDVLGLDDAIDVGVGAYHSCAVRANHTVVCWGTNELKQLGTTEVHDLCKGNTPCNKKIAAVENLSNAASVVCGVVSSCALTTGKQAICWGQGTLGEIGDTSGADALLPNVPVHGLSGVTQVAIASGTACAIAGGAVSCWGDNLDGRLGDGVTSHSPACSGGEDCAQAPVQVMNLSSGVSGIAAGSSSFCALHGGHVSCWGTGLAGQLGNDGTASSSTPVPTMMLSSATALVGGLAIDTRDHFCATQGSDVWCWGAAAYGQLGATPASTCSTEGPCSKVPIKADAPSGVQSLALGGAFTCAKLGTGGLACWGEDDVGQLGDGHMDSGGPAPVTVLPPMP